MIELNRFYCADSVEFMQETIPDNFVDLTVTSPPYDKRRKYDGYIFDYKKMLIEMFRVTKQGGIAVWIVSDETVKGNESGTSFLQALFAKECGFWLYDTMIYAKNNPIPKPHKRYNQQFEYMFVLSKGKPSTANIAKEQCKKAGKMNNKWFRNNGDVLKPSAQNIEIKEYKNKSNIWFYNVGYGNTTCDKIAFNHPAIFPDKLAEDHILSWSNPGDIVLDPMCGSGTTCKMAYLNNRNFIGIDMSNEYIDQICIPRLEKYGWANSGLTNL